MTKLCRNSECAHQLFSRVAYCPYCGALQNIQRVVHTEPSATPTSRISAPVADSTDVAGTDAGPVSSGGQSIPAELPPPLPPATQIQRTTPAHGRPLPARWLVIALAALVLLAAAIHLAAPLWPQAGYVAVTCDAPAASELAMLLDLPAQLEPSTRAEVLVRVTRALDAEHSGIRRISVFNTRSRHGDVATPVVSACSAPTMLGSLLGSHGLAPQLKSQILGKIESQLAVQESATALTQVVADLSVSQYLRAPQNTLLVFSDLIDKSVRFNLLSCDNSQDVIHNYRASHAGAVQRPAFRNTAVDLNAVPDLGIGPATARCRKAFWQWYFSDAEGPGAQLTMNFLPGRLKKKN